jgi:Ca-activated chloride channel family protein
MPEELAMPRTCVIGSNGLINVTSVLLLFLVACTQKAEPPAQNPASSQASQPPAPLDPYKAPENTVPALRASPSQSAPGADLGFYRREAPSMLGGLSRGGSYAPHYPWPVPIPSGVNRFPEKEPNGIFSAAAHPVSTFSVDVDSASYAFIRRLLNTSIMPPRESVRVEEMLNYFRYAYPAPSDRTRPFRVTTTVMPSPWNTENQLLHIAIRGYDIARADRPRANVVLLIDVSGSMQPADRLPLLQQAFRLFAQQLRDDDRVAIVTYANHVHTVLEPTSGRDKYKIIEAIDKLRANGGTAGGEGLQRAYALAERHFDKEAVNRVMLATDGDFNIGISDPKELERFIAGKRKSGIYLSIFGVGEGNLNDALMQRLTQAGNGNAAHVDSLLEARKALSEELSSTMFPIANDVKIQIEFNPARVAEYRLVGYETRMLRDADFNDDKVDAGDIGAGHTVTAIYEITPAGTKKRQIDPLRYQPERDQATPPTNTRADEIAFLKLRYKLPGETTSQLIEQPVRAADAFGKIDSAPAEQRFAVAVAAFGQRLRSENALDSYSYATIAELANGARGADAEGYRAEFIRLVRMAESLGAVAQR